MVVELGMVVTGWLQSWGCDVPDCDRLLSSSGVLTGPKRRYCDWDLMVQMCLVGSTKFKYWEVFNGKGKLLQLSL